MLTSQDWESIEKKLESFCRPVKLWIDGYRITLLLERLNNYKNIISVYVNGGISGKMLIHDCEERRKFFRCSNRNLYKRPIKKISRKRLRILNIDPDKKIQVYYPWFLSFRSLKAHLIKNNQIIEFYNEERHGKVSKPEGA